MQGAIRTIREAAGAGVEKLAKGATMAVAVPTMAATSAIGGTIKHTVKGMGAGIDAANGLRKKFLGEAAEAAAKGTDDVAQSAVSAGTKGVNGAMEFTSADGRTYRRTQNPNWSKENAGVGKYIYTNNGSAIDIKDFRSAYQDFTNAGGTFNDMPNPADVADATAKSGAGFWSGIQDWAQENTLLAAGIATGVGVAGGALLFGDDN